jgi:cytochrome c oxidase subunit IV
MSTDTAAHADHGHADDHADHAHGHGEHVDHPDSWYVKIALVLAAITAAEVVLSYMDVGAAFLPLLLTMMAVKFVMVVLFFMHLRFDSKWFNMAFWTGLILAILVYLAALTTFRFWG